MCEGVRGIRHRFPLGDGEFAVLKVYGTSFRCILVYHGIYIGHTLVQITSSRNAARCKLPELSEA
jgi:hypothetical protein